MESSLATNTVWLLICTALVFMMQAGFCCLESGLSRSKNSINVAVKNVVDFCIAGALFWLFGYALMFGDSLYGWIGTSDFVFSDATESHWPTAVFLFQLVFCGAAMTIASGAVAERMRFRFYLILAAVISGLIYPIFGHWAWGGLTSGESTGWLSQLGFIDFAGSTVVHSVGAWAALAAVLLLGPRIGRFEKGKPPHAFRGSNLPMVALGVFLLWLGWFGFNGGSTLALNGQVPSIIFNTMLAAIFGGLGALVWQLVRTRHVAVESVLNGVLAGLVGITASCNVVSYPAAAVIGLVAAFVMQGATYLLERRFQIDDVVGAIPVHGCAGVWGTLAVALFAPTSAFAVGMTRWGQLGVQILGAAVCFVWSFGMCWICIKLASKWISLRVTPEEERQGLNVAEHGATTDLFELLGTMERNIKGDASARASADAFTEAGIIAQQYNRVLDAEAASNRELLQQKERYKAILENVVDAIVTINGRGIIEEFNSAAERMFGYTTDEVLGKNVSMLMPSPFADEHDDHLACYRSTGNKHIIGIGRDVAGKRKDGSTFPVHLAVSEVASRTAASGGESSPIFTGIIRDLTEQKSREESLRRAKQEAEALNAFGHILDSSLNEIYIFDAESLHFVHVNRGVQDNLGYTMEELRGLRALDIKPEHTAASFEELIAPLREATQESIEYRTVHRRKDGSQYPVEVHLETSVLGGRPVFVAIILDITERQRIDEELRASRECAIAADRSKSEFLANMSHEIRTPMTAILGFADILVEGVTEPENIDAARTIKRNGEHLIKLINDILDLSKIEAGKLVVERIDCSPHNIVADVASLMRVRAAAKGLSLQVRFDGSIPELVQSDPVRLRQILINLVGNAIKFTETGSVEIVTRVLNPPGSEPLLQFQVIDTGIGIAADQIEKLFSPFTQADNSATRGFGGTGLGLTISKRLVELLGGRITMSSTPGKGTTVSVVVGAGAVRDIQRAVLASESVVEKTEDAPRPAEKTESPLHNRRILFVEDGPDNQRLVGLILKKAGAEVTLADNGQIGLDLASAALAENRPFDVILMDMQMPVMDGYEATRRLRSDGYSGPIIALTAHAMATDRQKCLRAGCDDYLTKPLDRKKLISTVAQHASREEHCQAGNAARLETQPPAVCR